MLGAGADEPVWTHAKDRPGGERSAGPSPRPRGTGQGLRSVVKAPGFGVRSDEQPQPPTVHPMPSGQLTGLPSYKEGPKAGTRRAQTDNQPGAEKGVPMMAALNSKH